MNPTAPRWLASRLELRWRPVSVMNGLESLPVRLT
jgi:hypothetical protein